MMISENGDGMKPNRAAKNTDTAAVEATNSDRNSERFFINPIIHANGPIPSLPLSHGGIGPGDGVGAGDGVGNKTKPPPPQIMQYGFEP
jgi:hypothetical protein